MYAGIIVCGMSWSTSHSYSQNRTSGVPILARVGDRVVEEREFVERFELTPGMNRRAGKALREEKEAVIYSLIAEKLLALAGIDDGLEKDTAFQQAFLEVRKLVARDQLYRQEISHKVWVSRQEIVRGMAQARRQLSVSFIYFELRDDADFTRRQIQTPRDFETLVVDSTMNAIRDTATVIWGDADWDIERASYEVKKNSVSQVISAGSGYYVLKILNDVPSVHFNSFSADALQQEVARTLRLRKERVRLDEFVRSALAGRTGFALSRSLRKTASSMAAVLGQPQFAGDSMLTVTAIGELIRRMRTDLTDSIAVAGSQVWSIEHVLRRLERAPLTLRSKDSVSLFGLLNTQLVVWVQQELLAQEAIARKLDETPEAARKLSVWKDAMLASMIKSRLAATAEVSDGDIWMYLSSRGSVKAPSVTIRELWSSSLSRIQEAVEGLHQGKTFEEMVREYSEETGEGKGGLVTMSMTSRAPIGHIAFSLSPGKIHGPLKVGERFLLFQVVGKDTLTMRQAGLTDEQVYKTREELRRMKQRRSLNQFLAAEGKKRGFTLFQDQLEKVQVSAIPMMSFRILGFGGRMMEVPFIDRQVEWLDTDVPGEMIP